MPIRVLLANPSDLASNTRIGHVQLASIYSGVVQWGCPVVSKVFTFGYEHLGHLRVRWFRPFFGQKRRVQILPEPLTCLLHPSRAAF